MNVQLNKEIKIPMIVGIILYAITLLITVLITIFQRTFISIYHNLSEDVFVISPVLYTTVINLLMLIIFYLVMKTYKGQSRRLAATIMIIVNIVVPTIFGFSSLFATYYYSRKGQEYLAAMSGLNTSLSLGTTIFSSVSHVLVIVALARYGISLLPYQNQMTFQGFQNQNPDQNQMTF